jgi:glycosyltransferase involved in cell wall biosynthesis
LGIGDRVHFTGRRDDIPNLMAGMDAVVSASVGFESLPTVLIEACALGVPVLGTDVGGAREIIRHGETGLLAPPAAPVVLARHLALLLSGAGRSLAERARVEARTRFSPARFGADLDDCYQAIAGRGAERRP